MTQMLSRPVDAPVVDVDVRDDLRNKREPFKRIMAAAESLPAGAVMHLRAILEPAPLYNVLGKKGFAHETEIHAPDDWSVWFWRSDDAGDAVAPVVASPAPADSNEVWLDVRGLEPPEPMVRTLEALAALPAGKVLVQVNVRVPQFLLPMLEERGFTYECDDSEAERVLVRIRPTSPSTFSTTMSQPKILDVRVIAPREKHPTIFSTFDSLKSGESMVIVNDHDPRPLRYQLSAERPDTFNWTYEEQGPEVWRVKIDRV